TVLTEPANGMLIGQGKTVALQFGDTHALAVPFSKFRDEVIFKKQDATGTLVGELGSTQSTRSVRNGDWVIVLAFSRAPHPNVVPTLIQYRQYYFDTYRPLLLKHVLRLIYERASQLQSAFTLGAPLKGVPDLWAALAQLCEDVLPTIFQALEVSGGVAV